MVPNFLGHPVQFRPLGEGGGRKEVGKGCVMGFGGMDAGPDTIRYAIPSTIDADD